MIPAWAGGYVGIPFVGLGRDRDGCDCWGLVRLILAERTGLVLPCWATAYESEANRHGVLGLAEEQKSEGPWRRIEPPAERAFDVIEMTQPVRIPSGAGTFGWGFLAIHAGLVVTPGWLIHVEHATAALLVEYRRLPMRNRVVAFWRHRELDDAA